MGKSGLKDTVGYMVISYYCGESADSKIWSAASYKDAVDKMNRLWEKSYNCALEDDNFDEACSYHEEEYAQVAWTDDLYRVFEVVAVSEKEEI